VPCIARHFFLKRRRQYRKGPAMVTAFIVAAVLLWFVSGHVLWNMARVACYNYVHYVKQERSFRDTLKLNAGLLADRSRVIWHKKDEISYAGRMFDIKRQLVYGDTVILVGHYDDLEHYLYKYLGKLFDDDGRPLQETKLLWHVLTALLPQTVEHTCPKLFASIIHKYYWTNYFHYSMTIPPSHRPPDMLY